MIYDYYILDNTSTVKLSEEVNSMIEQGWKPQGGVAILRIESIWYYQAMIKEGEG